MSRTRRPLRALGLLTAGALALVPLAGFTPLATSTPAAAASLDCPAGTARTTKTLGERAQERKQADPAFRELISSLDDASVDRATACRPVKQPEPFHELSAMQAERNVISAGPLGYTPPGAVRAALAGKAAATQATSTVPGAQGAFTPVGKTPLIADDPGAPNINGQGLADQAGRIDSYAYDAVHRRLFSAPGTGGVWMSRDTGQSWTSVGDTLPYQSVGSVTWSPAGPSAADGTLLVNSGEASAGGNVYTGIGGLYSTDTGKTWKQSTGIPDGLMGFEIEVDPSNPTIVYAATSQGLFRSTDTGRTYVNVKLPTADCAGVTGYDNICQNANWVTDVQIKAPGGVGADTKGGQVLAAVGYRAGRLPYPGTDVPQAPANGVYRSDTGAPGTFEMLDVSGDGTSPIGFTPQERIGRFELGAATGPEQDHDVVYAVVEDAVLFNGGVIGIDAFDTTTVMPSPAKNTVLSGIYVSSDFGSSWIRMADELELQLPITESALIGAQQTVGMYAPGVQGWYNQWIEPDPTTATAAGVPTRLVFGLEEVWATRLPGTPQDGLTQAAEPASFRVIGPYYAGDSCLGLAAGGFPICPTTQTTAGSMTTHPDQQSGIWVPEADGGVTLVLGNDGGTYRQTVAPGAELTKDFGRGAQAGYLANTLLPYDASAAKDGTVAFGLQDNGSGVVRPDGKVVETFGGDGFFAAIDPDDSDVYYNEVTLADMRVTQDGGLTYTDIAPDVTNPLFANPFVMDPTDSGHLIVGGPEVFERTEGPTGDWVQVFTTGEGTQVSMLELQGAAAYVGFCSTCDIANKVDADFNSGIATNVGGDAAPEKGDPAGWHIAAAKGLPDRYVTGIAADPTNPKTVYVTLSGYANRQWWPAGSFNDKNGERGAGHVFKSTDAGQTFTDISGSLPDAPARSIEVNRGQLLVGTDVGLFLSSNTSGQRWAALKGLPNVPVVSVKNMPGKPDQVVLATFGRGIYTYGFSARAGASTPVTGPGTTPIRPTTGRLPATGLGATAAAIGVLALLGGLAVRRRAHA